MSTTYIMKDLGYPRTPVTDDKKWIAVIFNDNLQYKIPTQVICDHRDEYFQATKEDTFNCQDDSSIEDWLFNNMDWKDVSAYAVQIPINPPTLDELWCDAEVGALYDGNNSN